MHDLLGAGGNLQVLGAVLLWVVGEIRRAL
jgi:hypothetical protein